MAFFSPVSPQLDFVYDETRPADPYWQNRPITNNFINMTSYKNQRNGAIALDIADTRFINFKIADNILAGIEVELSNTLVDGYARVDNALVVGYTENADDFTMSSDSRGIIGPRTENFLVNNVRFYNFDKAGKAALGTCSHCFSLPSTDSGGRTLTVSNLFFASSVSRRIHYQAPRREIIYDKDGTLTGLGAKTWATPYWRHNDWPEC